MKFALVVLMSLFTLNSFAAEFRVQKVKVLGPMKHKVIFQSADLKKLKRTNVIKGKIVAQWGLHVFEVANGFYACNSSNLCKLTDFERVATYESCVVKNKTKVECRKKLSGEASGDRSEIVISEDPDSVRSEYHHERYNDEYSEFPVRVRDEFEDIF